jgi:hypothetical protein
MRDDINEEARNLVHKWRHLEFQSVLDGIESVPISICIWK